MYFWNQSPIKIKNSNSVETFKILQEKEFKKTFLGNNQVNYLAEFDL